ncbi:MAG TPA: hypothetical protein VGJ03_12675 [Acidimicrobiales bacterium]
MSNARQLLDDLTRQLKEQDEATSAVPDATPPGEHRRLCIGMATFDDFDGVYFTVQSLRMYHPEVLDEVSFLVLDNHPEGPASGDLKGLDSRIPHLRYFPFRGYRSTAARDLIFRNADADIVLCLDSHVLLRAGAVRALLDFFDANPTSRDLVQGPLVDDRLESVIGSHLSATWGGGMYGRWDTDDRAKDPDGPPFEIEMQGLGVFACRREAWPGLNPRFRGFGGEEGYLHEKVRRNGGRVLCLPALAWTHRFARPGGPPYRPTWEDRVRNYRIGWGELDWDAAPMEAHFRDHVEDPERAEIILEQTERQLASPFTFFDAVFCLNLDRATDRWETMSQRFGMLDIGWRVERFPAVDTPDNHHRGVALSFRAMIAEAQRRGYANVLVIEDDAVFLDSTIDVLGTAVDELATHEWDIVYLGGCPHGRSFPFVEGSSVLQEPSGMTCTHALAFNHTSFDRLLDELPAADAEDPAAFDAWLAKYVAIDQYLPRRIDSGAYRALAVYPRVASQPALTQYADSDLALRARYTI